MITAGFPASDALESLNSLLVLRGMAGAVTVDLAQVQLDTGKAVLYKWGAAPSLVLKAAGAEKIGTAGPPPGIGVTDTRKTAQRLSLRHGETLILLSDGVDGEEIPHRAGEWEELPPGELADAILEQGRGEGADDATAVVIRLVPASLST
jgi:serine phosphatase RsbU (regulator of sigma subunit)